MWFHQNPWLGCYGCWLVVWWFGGTTLAIVKRPPFIVKGQREKWPLVVGLADHWTSIQILHPGPTFLHAHRRWSVFLAADQEHWSPWLSISWPKKRSTPSCAQESAQSYAQDKTWKGNQLSCWTFFWKYDSKIDRTVSFLKHGLKVLKVHFTATPPLGDLLEVALIPHQKKTHWHMLELSTMRSHWVSGHPRPPHHGGHPRLPRCDSALLHGAKLPSNNQIRANLDLNTNESIASTSPWDSGTTGDWLLHTCTSCLSYASGTASSVVNISFKKIGSSSHFLTSHILQNCYRLIGRPRRAWLRGLTCPADLSPAPMTGKWRVKWL